MNNLLAELMAESERVKALEAEVQTATDNMKNQIGLARQEKYSEIRNFLYEMHGVFKAACPGESLILYMPGEYKDGNHTWSNSVRIGKQRYETDSIWIGIYMTGSGCFHEHTILVENPYFDDRLWGYSLRTFVDKWTPDTNEYIEKRVADEIRLVLSKRIDKATANLKTVNKKHEEYYGKGV